MRRYHERRDSRNASIPGSYLDHLYALCAQRKDARWVGKGRPPKPSFRSVRPYCLLYLASGREALLNRDYQVIGERGRTGRAYWVGPRYYDNVVAERWLKDPPDLRYFGPASPAAKQWVNELLTKFFFGQDIQEFLKPESVKIGGMARTVEAPPLVPMAAPHPLRAHMHVTAPSSAMGH